MFRVRASIPCALLALALVSGWSPGLSAQGGGEESLVEITARWQQFLAGVKDLPREERLARSRDFLDGIPWARIEGFCSGEHARSGPDLNDMLQGLVAGKLKASGGDTRCLVRLVADPSANAGCQLAIVKHLSQHRDSLLARPGDAAAFAEAMLALADSGQRPRGIVFDLERGAASLQAGDGILARAMERLGSADLQTAIHGVNMLGAALDPRAGDSLAAFARRHLHAADPSPVLGRSLNALASRTGRAHFDFLLEAYEHAMATEDAPLRRETLYALANTQDPGFYPVLLAEYADEGTGIVDSTHAFEDRDLRSFYWTRWHLTRLAEPGIIRDLNADAETAFGAIPLLDRASRFGLPASRDGLLEPLAAWAERRGGPWPGRIADISARYRSYADPIPASRSGN